MNSKQITLLLLLFFGIAHVFAYDINIDAQITAMQHASPRQRVALMNRLKKSIIHMNQQDRQRAIRRLRQASRSRTQVIQPQRVENIKSRMQMHQMDQHINTHQVNAITQKENIIKSLPTSSSVTKLIDNVTVGK